MKGLTDFIDKHGQLLLKNDKHVLLHVIVLALLPYTAWLSVALLALITLRKGGRQGANLLGPVIAANVLLSLILGAPIAVALINAWLLFVPCYAAACVLRATANWRAVAGLFLLLVIIVVLSLQLFMPDMIMAQYLYLQSVLQSMPTESAVLSFIHDKTAANPSVFANYLLGFQAVGVVSSAVFPLLLARSVQSRLFYPGEFKKEMLSFRAEKIGLLLLFALFFGVSQQNTFAMSLLPLFLFYFLLAGLSLSFKILEKQKPMRATVLLLAALFLLPLVMLPVYVIFGLLDSVFNFRLYARNK